MTFLTGLHGTIATLLICALLFIDEAGVPLPFAPNEFLLVVAGLLIAGGALSPLVFFPLALTAMVGGLLTGFGWARAIGPAQLRTLATKLRATRAYDHATARMRTTNERQVAVTRLIPGIRVYATLAAGAAGVDRMVFLRGAIPSLALWLTAVTGLGYVVGLPAVRFLTEIERVAISGGILVILGLLAYRAARTSPRDGRGVGPFTGARMPLRLGLAVAADAGVVACIAAGFDRITRFFLHLPIPTGKVDTAIVLTAIAVSYVVAARTGSRGETAGERLFDVSYVHPRSAAQRTAAPGGASMDPESPVVP